MAQRSNLILAGTPPTVVSADAKAILSWATESFAKLASQLNSPPESRYVVLHVAPEKPRAGMLVYADGTDWNPGFGEGLYTFSIAGAWVPVTQKIPIGGIYISNNSTNPATSFGYGTWSAYAAGRVLVGFSSGETEFDADEETGGEKTHTLTTPEMPAHTHTFALASTMASGGGQNIALAGAAALTSSTGGGGSHNNLQPYITVRIWKRTA